MPVRVQATDGTWLVVHGAELHGGDAGQRVVVIEKVAPRELASVIVRAYGLSSRERQVAELVLRGLPTKQVARALELSPHTVTDYLRTLFDKVGVRSRRELAARLLVITIFPACSAARRSDPTVGSSTTPTQKLNQATETEACGTHALESAV